MKHILLVIGLCVITIWQVAAQDVSHWVGKSANPDPIMRHHEAFMDAFIKYLQSRPTGQVGTIYMETTDSSSGDESINKGINNETCRVETVSSVTYEGHEIITISIGSGALVEYACLTESYSGDEIIQATTILKIVYQEETDRIVTQSVHEFTKETITDKRTAARTNRFSYECTAIGYE